MTRIDQIARPSGVRAPHANAGHRRRIHPYLFVLPYTVMLLALGVGPAGYAIYLAFTHASGDFAGFSNFTQAADDYRFWPAFENAFRYVAIWVLLLLVFAVGLALLLFRRPPRAAASFRVAYFLPGAFAGAASGLVWLFMLDPAVSPAGGLLRLLGLDSLTRVLEPGQLPFVFATIAFWTGAGGWILVMTGGLNNIPRELSEAARIDGCNTLQRALYIELPLLRKWIAYMAILAFAAGTQIFVEPQLVMAASLGVVPAWWSPNQLAYLYAFQQGDFQVAAAISVELLLAALICAAVIVNRTGLFDIE